MLKDEFKSLFSEDDRKGAGVLKWVRVFAGGVWVVVYSPVQEILTQATLNKPMHGQIRAS